MWNGHRIIKGGATSRRRNVTNAGETNLRKSISEIYYFRSLTDLRVHCDMHASITLSVDSVLGMFYFWAASCQGKFLKITQVPIRNIIQFCGNGTDSKVANHPHVGPDLVSRRPTLRVLIPNHDKRRYAMKQTRQVRTTADYRYCQSVI